MKRLYYIISFLVILFLFNSCYDDDSSLAVKEIAEIHVTCYLNFRNLLP